MELIDIQTLRDRVLYWSLGESLDQITDNDHQVLLATAWIRGIIKALDYNPIELIDTFSKELNRKQLIQLIPTLILSRVKSPKLPLPELQFPISIGNIQWPVVSEILEVYTNAIIDGFVDSNIHYNYVVWLLVGTLLKRLENYNYGKQSTEEKSEKN